MAEQSGLRRVIWMAFGALVTSVADIPIGYSPDGGLAVIQAICLQFSETESSKTEQF
jgi:hypothetical protein